MKMIKVVSKDTDMYINTIWIYAVMTGENLFLWYNCFNGLRFTN